MDGGQALYQVRARWYDPQVGRFISEDPIGLEGGINAYTYAGNDPVNNLDPTGLDIPLYCWYEETTYASTSGAGITSTLRCSGGGGGTISGGSPNGPREGPEGPPRGGGGGGSSNTPGPDRPGSSMAQCLASIFTASGSTGAGITEHTSIRGRGANAQWRGMNGKWNRIGWGGNQWTGGRNAIVAAGRRAQVAGRAFGGVGIAMSGVQAFHSARQGDWNAVAGHGLDAAMVGVGFAGAVGFGVSLAYFGVSYFAGCAG